MISSCRSWCPIAASTRFSTAPRTMCSHGLSGTRTRSVSLACHSNSVRLKLTVWYSFIFRHQTVLGLGSALLYLNQEWDQRILHRDIKPSNIMLAGRLLQCHARRLQTREARRPHLQLAHDGARRHPAVHGPVITWSSTAPWGTWTCYNLNPSK